MTLAYTTRPLSDRTWLRPDGGRRRAQFSASWSGTLALLGTEIDHLDGRDVAIEVDITESDLRLDGGIRATARPEVPAVVVAFDSQHGPMLHRSDRYTVWQDNVRAVALTLQALRAVDRYGTTDTGQQYQGFKAIGGGTGAEASHMTRDAAIAVLAEHGTHGDVPPEHLNLDLDSLRSTWRRARRLAHPDRHDGTRALWDQVEQAARVLGLDRSTR